MPLGPNDFELVRQIVREHVGILLDTWKGSLVETRLGAIAREERLGAVEDLMRQLRSRPRGPLATRVVESLLTTETSFFRDVHPFEALRQFILPDLVSQRQARRRLTIWSAGCASGQEIYSVAMLIREHFPSLLDWSLELVGTDVSSAMLGKAAKGRYTELEINRGLPAAALVKYFEQHGLEWQIKLEVRAMVEFLEMNLAGSWRALPKMDIIFLRNVLVYFDVEKKREILAKVRRQLHPDGFLFLGGAESTINLDDDFQPTYFGPAVVYRLRARVGEAA
ncbi:MAG TPA: protein-glutamate O-methyltransferase CheR [Thermoanaerobaculaceae bacterium]|nr:protein-glutamate O-methyltransferase CheR [Thermoanaerobaculaceae bacterium]